jgi:phosphohistidine phosphatase
VKLIVLVRHAKAEEHRPGRPDHSRALTKQGREDAQTLGRALTALGFEPEVALVSDAARTVETWVIASRGWDVPEVERSRDLYNTTVGELIETLRGLPVAVERVIVVGHNPTVSSVAAYLAVDKSNEKALEQASIGLRTGTAALLEYQGDWEDLGQDVARLRAVVGRGDQG